MKKIHVQIVDTSNNISQYGMIEEPVKQGLEIINALKHFGVDYGHVSWYSKMTEGDLEGSPIILSGNVEGTSKIVNVIAY